MRCTPDAIQLVASANPVPDADRMPAGPRSAAAQALREGILSMDDQRSIPRPSRRTTAVLVAAMLVFGATAAWAYTQSGIFPDPAFSGETWKLTVGEMRNGPDGETFKVCHVFARRVGANMANGFGTAGCGEWPSDRVRPVIIDVVPAVHEQDTIALFVDLTTVPVAKVSVTPDRGPRVDVRPYVMPQTRKQYAVAEIRDDATSATVRLFDHDGEVIERRTIDDLAVTPPPEP